MFCLDGKVALVTGASRGIGACIARTLATAGAQIVVNHLNEPEEAEAVCAQIRELGGKAIPIAADVRSEPQVREMFAQIDKEPGRIDILVNNAGVGNYEDIFNTTIGSWRWVLETHLTGTFLCAQQAMERMKSQRYGRIIQISSVVAHQGALRGFVHYATAKSGQLGFTRTLARTGAEFGITVNAVAPGMIGTDLFYRTHGEEGAKKLEELALLGLGKPEDVAVAVLFLASSEASFITGTVLDVNGGLYFR
ncbi:MAG: 3-oxoacyl-ACP reductase family protein [Bryobacteraceae bacterium]